MIKLSGKSIDFALRQLLMDGKVGTHEEICQALEQQGFYVNQPKISRLLHKLGAIKVTNQDGENSYRLPHEHGLMHELQTPNSKFMTLNWILDISNNSIMIVVHTTPGAAGMVAREIDLHHANLGILGCIAGDDTIFIVPKDVKDVAQVKDKMMAMFNPAS